MQSRVKIVLAGLAALLALGSVLSVSAFAGPGPFWHQRKAGEKGNGVKISQLSPEKFQAKGGNSVLTGVLSGEAPRLECAEDKAGGILYNGNLQGQGKIRIDYEKCTTNFKNCIVNEPIEISTNFYLMWKYRGSKEELEPQAKQVALGQIPGLLVYPGEIKQGTKSLAKEALSEIKFKKNGVGECVIAGIPLVFKGYESATIGANIEQFKTAVNIGFTSGPHEQHFWNGLEQVPLTTSLFLGESEAIFESQVESGPFLTRQNAKQEVALFES